MKCGREGCLPFSTGSFVASRPGLVSCSWKMATVSATSEGPIQTGIFIGGRIPSPLGTDTDVNLGLPSDFQGKPLYLYTKTKPRS